MNGHHVHQFVEADGDRCACGVYACFRCGKPAHRGSCPRPKSTPPPPPPNVPSVLPPKRDGLEPVTDGLLLSISDGERLARQVRALVNDNRELRERDQRRKASSGGTDEKAEELDELKPKVESLIKAARKFTDAWENEEGDAALSDAADEVFLAIEAIEDPEGAKAR